MAVIGIICEYNPFHRGHAAMLQRARQPGDTVVCAMSGNFVQRGESALCGKLARGEMALRGGADLVLELPTPWAMAGAETFARGGVALLAMAGCDTLAFGSESGDGAAIVQAAEALLNPDFPECLQAHLKTGVTFAAARQRAAAAYSAPAAAILGQPNDILAVEYAKAVRQAGGGMALCPIRRMGVAHHGTAGGGLASASHVRALLRQGRWEEAAAYLPESSAAILRREQAAGRIADAARLEGAILSRLRQLTPEELSQYDGGGEGLYRRFYAALHSAATLPEVLEAAKTKRYPLSRLRRMAWLAWLGAEPPAGAVPYLRVLAANGRGRALLRQLQEAGQPVLTKPADVDRLGAEARALFAAEARYTDQFLLAMERPQPPGEDWRYTPFIQGE